MGPNQHETQSLLALPAVYFRGAHAEGAAGLEALDPDMLCNPREQCGLRAEIQPSPQLAEFKLAE